jgi:hypothetical protein
MSSKIPGSSDSSSSPASSDKLKGPLYKTENPQTKGNQEKINAGIKGLIEAPYHKAVQLKEKIIRYFGYGGVESNKDLLKSTAVFCSTVENAIERINEEKGRDNLAKLVPASVSPAMGQSAPISATLQGDQPTTTFQQNTGREQLRILKSLLATEIPKLKAKIAFNTLLGNYQEAEEDKLKLYKLIAAQASIEEFNLSEKIQELNKGLKEGNLPPVAQELMGAQLQSAEESLMHYGELKELQVTLNSSELASRILEKVQKTNIPPLGMSDKELLKPLLKKYSSELSRLEKDYKNEQDPKKKLVLREQIELGKLNLKYLNATADQRIQISKEISYYRIRVEKVSKLLEAERKIIFNDLGGRSPGTISWDDFEEAFNEAYEKPADWPEEREDTRASSAWLRLCSDCEKAMNLKETLPKKIIYFQSLHIKEENQFLRLNYQERIDIATCELAITKEPHPSVPNVALANTLWRHKSLMHSARLDYILLKGGLAAERTPEKIAEIERRFKESYDNAFPSSSRLGTDPTADQAWSAFKNEVDQADDAQRP